MVFPVAVLVSSARVMRPFQVDDGSQVTRQYNIWFHGGLRFLAPAQKVDRAAEVDRTLVFALLAPMDDFEKTRKGSRGTACRRFNLQSGRLILCVLLDTSSSYCRRRRGSQKTKHGPNEKPLESR